MNSSQVKLDPEKAHQEALKQYEGALSEQALFLEPLSQNIAVRWAELYLHTFGRDSFFSSQRVEKIFEELTRIFIGCLKERCLDVYFENLREKGRLFSRLGVPFEEVIISMHLFEEVCLEQYLEAYPNRSKLPKMILAMEELHSEGLSAIATTYFDTVKREMQSITDALKEENEGIRTELAQMKESYFARTTKELSSMQLLVSSINHKLKSRLYQLSRIQKISDALEVEPHLPRLFKIASQNVLGLCPPNSQVLFGLFDEERKKVNLYALESPSSPQCDIVDTMFFSELSSAFQDVLYREDIRSAHFSGRQDIPQPILDKITVKGHREFFMMPIRQYREIFGFFIVSTDAADFFSKSNCKFFQRIGQAVSRAAGHAIRFNHAKKQDDFATLMDEIQKRDPDTQPIEATLDFYLGSLIDLLGAERSSVMRFDTRSKELRVCAAKGYKVYPISGMPIKWGEGVAGTALKDSKILSITRIRDSHPPAPLLGGTRHKDAPETKLKSLLCLPLLDGNMPVGVVNVSTINFHRSFEKSDIDMAHKIVDRLADLVKRL